jgi:Na+-transporting NADH:ubiquinone oxidoreductase subunit D
MRKHLRSFLLALHRSNPVTVGLLGICSALAVTSRLSNALAMGVMVITVLLGTAFLISLLRKTIPDRMRLLVVMMIVSVFVITGDRLLQAWFPLISRELGPYVGLIITNCIILGRAEACYLRSPILPSLGDAFIHGLGYTGVLLAIAFFRELLGFGSLFGFMVMPESWPRWSAMTLAPGAFFVLSLLIWIGKERRQ